MAAAGLLWYDKLMKQEIEYSLSGKTLLIILLTGLGIFLAWQLSDLLILLVTGIMLAATLNPFVKWIHRKTPFSLTWSAAIIMILLVLPLIFAIISMIPAILDNFSNISTTIMKTVNGYKFLPHLFQNLEPASYAKEGGQYLLESTMKISNFFTETVILVFLTFYLLIDAERLHNLFLLTVPRKEKKRIEKVLRELAGISGHYIRGNILISVICSSIIFTGLFFLNVPNAAALAIFAGILDLLPLIGSIIGAVPAVILSFAISPLTGFLTIALFIIYQEIENNLLAPHIYNKALNIIPLMSFLSVIIGSALFGIPGAFLSLPIAASIPTVIHYFHDLKTS